MPAPSGPHSLASWSLYTITSWAIEASKKILENETLTDAEKWKRIHEVQKKYIWQIPGMFVNRYIQILSSRLVRAKRESLMSILGHPSCNSLLVTGTCMETIPWTVIYFNRFRLLTGLSISPGCPCSQKTVNFDSGYMQLSYLANSIQNFIFLRVVQLPLVCTYKLLLNISRFCPLLSVLEIPDCHWQQGNLLCLQNCRFLSRLNCCIFLENYVIHDWYDAEVAYLVDKLPLLETLYSYDFVYVMKYLDQSRSYSLTDIYFEFVYEIDFKIFSKMFPRLRSFTSTMPLGSQLLNLQPLPIKLLTVFEESCDDLIPYFKDNSDIFVRLTFTSIENLHKVFSRYTFQTLYNVTFFNCHELNLVKLNESAPKLTILRLEDCSAIEIEQFSTKSGFPNLERLRVSRGEFSSDHLRFLLGSCKYLENLRLENIFSDCENEIEVLTDDAFLAVVHCSELKDLRTLYLHSNLLTNLVVKHIFQYCDVLEDLTLKGSQWGKEFSANNKGKNVLLEVQKYRMRCTVESGDFVYYYNSTIRIEHDETLHC